MNIFLKSWHFLHKQNITDPLCRGLAILKLSSQSAFSRSIAFILTVNKTSQTLVMYNVTPAVFGDYQVRFYEIVGDVLLSQNCQQEFQQLHCLGRLAFKETSQIMNGP